MVEKSRRLIRATAIVYSSKKIRRLFRIDYHGLPHAVCATPSLKRVWFESPNNESRKSLSVITSMYTKTEIDQNSKKQFQGYLLHHSQPVTPSLCCQSNQSRAQSPPRTLYDALAYSMIQWRDKSRYAFPFPLSSGPVSLPSESLGSLRRAPNWIRGSRET